MYILSLQQQAQTVRQFHLTWYPIMKAQQTLPTSAKVVMKFLVPHWVGNFTDWVAFSFTKKAVFSCRCHFGSLINGILNGTGGGGFFPGVQRPEPEADHAFTACGYMNGV